MDQIYLWIILCLAISTIVADTSLDDRLGELEQRKARTSNLRGKHFFFLSIFVFFCMCPPINDEWTFHSFNWAVTTILGQAQQKKKRNPRFSTKFKGVFPLPDTTPNTQVIQLTQVLPVPDTTHNTHLTLSTLSQYISLNTVLPMLFFRFIAFWVMIQGVFIGLKSRFSGP